MFTRAVLRALGSPRAATSAGRLAAELVDPERRVAGRSPARAAATSAGRARRRCARARPAPRRPGCAAFPTRRTRARRPSPRSRGTAIAIAGAAATASTTVTPAGAAAASLRQRLGAQRRIDDDQDRRQRRRGLLVDLGRHLDDAQLGRGDAGDHLDLDLVAAVLGGRGPRRQDRDHRPLELDRIEAPVRRTIAAPAAHERRGRRRRRAAWPPRRPRGPRWRRTRRPGATPARARAARPAPPAGNSTSSGGTRSTAAYSAGPWVTSSGGAPRPGPSQDSTLSAPARPRLRRDPLVEVAIGHHDREHRHARDVRHASSLGEREQRRTGGDAVAKVDGNEQIRQRAPRGTESCLRRRARVH